MKVKNVGRSTAQWRHSYNFHCWWWTVNKWNHYDYRVNLLSRAWLPLTYLYEHLGADDVLPGGERRAGGQRRDDHQGHPPIHGALTDAVTDTRALGTPSLSRHSRAGRWDDWAVRTAAAHASLTPPPPPPCNTPPPPRQSTIDVYITYRYLLICTKQPHYLVFNNNAIFVFTSWIHWIRIILGSMNR